MKHKNLIHTLSFPLLALLALVFTGCASISVPPPVPAPPIGPGSGSGSGGGHAAVSRASQLQIAVDAYAPDAADEPLASAIEKQIEGRLNQQGLQVTPEGGDLSVGITVSSEIFDKSGNYLVMEGAADTSVHRNYDRSTVASKQIKVRASRQLGATAARDALVSELSRETAAWVAGSLDDRSLQLSANDVTVTVPIFRNAADYSRKFIREVGQVDGVASVILVQEDSQRKKLTFRVTYFKNKIPAGILHRIARIDDLRIRL